jgi:hypothetical protein
LRVTREELLTRIAESVTTVRAGRW